MDIIEGNFYNIDKINCIVEKNVAQETKVYNTKGTPKVIYKPIFYRTYDLQNINFQMGLVQNIGINLSEYMTKVDSFKLSIDGKEYIEFARNDIYVIFKVDATPISRVYGNYHIMNQEGDYISTGKYTIVNT